jgi:hypothetical protein
VRQSPASKDMNMEAMEAKEAMASEAITRWEPMKMQQTEKNLYVLQWIAECVWISNSAIVTSSYDL